MYHLGPWGFAQVLNQYQHHVGVEQSYSDNVLTARSKKGPVTIYLQWRSLGSLYLKFLQFSVTFLDTTFFFLQSS